VLTERQRSYAAAKSCRPSPGPRSELAAPIVLRARLDRGEGGFRRALVFRRWTQRSAGEVEVDEHNIAILQAVFTVRTGDRSLEVQLW
jgi:hypothetical protein